MNSKHRTWKLLFKGKKKQNVTIIRVLSKKPSCFVNKEMTIQAYSYHRQNSDQSAHEQQLTVLATQRALPALPAGAAVLPPQHTLHFLPLGSFTTLVTCSLHSW